ncbi:hypothetical protein Tco_1005380 [Tanacetum coccineum]|uniref:Maturase K n=1 Tax=Tanacetum coccineum TaxID=301880 RepID=A0ABQ5FEZ8_9ASTR
MNRNWHSMLETISFKLLSSSTSLTCHPSRIGPQYRPSVRSRYILSDPVWMEYFDLWDSCIIKALKSPKRGIQLRLFRHNVLSARGSSLLIMPCKSSLMKFSSFLASD